MHLCRAAFRLSVCLSIDALSLLMVSLATSRRSGGTTDHCLSPAPLLRPSSSQLDEARRFVSLIDVLYERRATLRVLSACSPEGIFERLLSVSSTPPLGILQQKQRGTRGEGDAAGGSSVGGSDRGGLPPPLPPPAAAIRPDPDVHECRPLTREERLMCLRTVSRLRQMCPPPAATPSPPSGGASPPVV